MNLKPMGYYVLIEIPKKEEEAQSNIIIMPKDFEDSELNAADIGIVRAIGPAAFSGMDALNGTTGAERAKQWGFEVGDTVEFTRYDGKRPSTKGYENFRSIQDQHIITKVEV